MEKKKKKTPKYSVTLIDTNPLLFPLPLPLLFCPVESERGDWLLARLPQHAMRVTLSRWRTNLCFWG